MARPYQKRKIENPPEWNFFKPSGVPAGEIEAVILTYDEFEAIRLADFNGLYQNDAAAQMGVSRQTFGRIIESAHYKISQSLVLGKAIKIEGGEVEMTARKFTCDGCRHIWEIPFGTGRPKNCPSCNGENFHRTNKDSYRGKKRRCRQQECRSQAP